MGLSVTAACVIIFFGFLAGFAIFYSVATNFLNELLDAIDEKYNRLSEAVKTSILLENATYSNTNLTLRLNNTGSTTIKVDELNVLANGICVSDKINTTSTTVNGVRTNLWLPRTTLILQLNSILQPPSRVKVTTTSGASAYTTNIYIV